jgi:NAD(P)-dependent dehydrogenase (short-subunit alcohol dehydrogenase family)
MNPNGPAVSRLPAVIGPARVAVVTGAASGIGLGLAERFINGVRAFMPVLLEQEAAHVLNTSSILGVFAGALGPYGISKHSVAVTASPIAIRGPD